MGRKKQGDRKTTSERLHLECVTRRQIEKNTHSALTWRKEKETVARWGVCAEVA